MKINKQTLGLLILNSLIVLGFAVWGQLAKVNQQKQLSKLLSENKGQTVLGLAARNSNCQIQGPLPDSNCTPGSVFPLATVEEICVSGYTKTVRNVSVSTKKQVYEMYGIEYPPPSGSYEADHHIPLALGGNNEVANLWPEAGDPKPGFKEKDVVEVYLREQVCAGKINLQQAQIQIAKDWVAVYNLISSDEIKRIKSIYKNWSN